MGSSASKQTSVQASEHVFAAGTPVSFSQGLIESLQSNPEARPELAFSLQLLIANVDAVQTDSTREKTLELHIQSRVAAELEKLRERESRVLKELEDQISDETLSSPENPNPRQVESPTSTTVHESITSLRSKLASRRKLEEVDESVEKAKDNVVKCLRENDRRPLDCWREVEAFRKEVGRLERNFVEKVIG
ncbi:MAG: hypothetical protein M1840_007072 [Geoglossum simile]|nr:MAG: hypothetical protein M1840_007072 [Geoglossum simile]